jgi:multicomponent Na+:H+ antiporter subunit G
MIMEYIIGFFVLLGSAFIFISAIGILKLHDLYLRMSATTKATTLGVGSVLIGAAMFFSDVGIITLSIAIIIFLLITAPVAAHMIGRASYFDNVPLWSKTKSNEMKEYYDNKKDLL